MRILMLTQWFQPEPFFKGLPLAKALRDRGHDVQVLTGFPNYPGGKLYPGYRVRPWQRETMDGIRVNRVALFPSHDRSSVRRILNYLTFSGSAAILGPWLSFRPEVVYVYNLVTLGAVARLLRILKGSRVVLDVQDLWPESVTGSGMLGSRILLSALNRWCRREYSKPDRLVVLSPGFKRKLSERGVNPARIDVVYNWCDETAIRVPEQACQASTASGFAGRFNVVFAGTMGIMQGLDVVIEAAKLLQDSAPDVLFTLVGGGVDVERLKSRAVGMPNVQLLPSRPMSEIGSIYAEADALLVHLKNHPLFEITIPSKIQAYMYAGKPILCGVRGDAAGLVEQARAGIPFEPENPSSLADAVLALRGMAAAERAEMGMRGKAFYQDQLSFEHGVRHLEDAFTKAISEM